jgi:succinate dehydrogenase (ubiquinone) cytochrome b560 subunit
VVSTAAALPAAVLFAGKFILAAPYSYHFFNGVRHLMWDVKMGLTLKGVYATGYATNAATVASTLYLLTL